MEALSNKAITLEIDKIESISFNPLAKNYPLLCAIETGIFWFIIIAAVAIASLVTDKINIPILTFVGVSLIALLGIFISYHGAKAKGYSLREKDVLYRSGLIWKKQTGVSFKRIQHIDIANGPIERHFGLSTIKFFTAGGAMADLRISGLPAKETESMRNFILKEIGLIDE